MQYFRYITFYSFLLVLTVLIISCGNGSSSTNLTTPSYNSQTNLKPVTANRFAYIASDIDQRITICQIDSDQLLSECNKFNPSFPGSPTLTGLALAPSGKRLYISTSNSKIYMCNINNRDGTLSNCLSKSDYTISSPTFMAVDLVKHNLYISDSKNNTVVVCNIDIDDSEILKRCNIAGEYFALPRGIAISKDGYHAYINNTESGTVSICSIKNDGTFVKTPCDYEEGIFVKPSGLAVSPSNQYLFITDADSYDSVKVCSLAPDGNSFAEVGCVSQRVSEYPKNDDIVLDSTGTNAYITVPDRDSVYNCIVINGGFEFCHSTADGSFVSPNAIAIT